MSSLFSFCVAINKYTKEANLPELTEDLKTLEKPFRLAKVNLVWSKAQKRLSELKLKSLYSELKVQDKEELQLKRFKADGLDKDGLKEAALRHKFSKIIERFGLADHFDDEVSGKTENLPENDINYFKDKKLQRLWAKAESAGFTETELKALREEFLHHQEKVDQFYSIMESHNSMNSKDRKNEIHLEELQNLEETKPTDKEVPITNIREKNRELKNAYDRLERMTFSGPKRKAFEEDKVQTLWKAAQQASFTPEELESLRTELRHYEQRVLKLRYLQAQHGHLMNTPNEDKVNKTDLEQRIKMQARKVEKIHADLEIRITQKHLEL